MPSGPLRVRPNGRYFVRDGKPFFWLGDTEWELFRCFPTEEARVVLEHRKRQGFSVLQIMFTGVGDGSKPNLAGQTPTTTPRFPTRPTSNRRTPSSRWRENSI